MPVPKVFLFYGAEAFQTSYVLKKGNLCPGIKYDDLKRIVSDSGKPYVFLLLLLLLFFLFFFNKQHHI